MVEPEPTDNSSLVEPESTDNSSLRKKFSGEETLDTKTMRIMDMIYYNPKKGQMLTRKTNEKERSVEPEGKSTNSKEPVEMKKKVVSDNRSDDTKPVVHEVQQQSARPSAPQVKIGIDGNIILDETSLVVQESNESSLWETIDGDKTNHTTTSLSFRNRLWRKGTQWTEKETKLFYGPCFGPDFSLMHEYFPARARRELKSKYNREEKNNWSKLNDAMSRPLALDESLTDRVERLQKEIEEDAEKPIEKKDKRKGLKDNSLIDWDENTADLVAEAEHIIHALEEEARRNESLFENSWDNEYRKKKMTFEARRLISTIKQRTKENKDSRTAIVGLRKRGYAGFTELSDDAEEDYEDNDIDWVEEEEDSDSNNFEILCSRPFTRRTMKEVPQINDRILRSSTRQNK